MTPLLPGEALEHWARVLTARASHGPPTAENATAWSLLLVLHAIDRLHELHEWAAHERLVQECDAGTALHNAAETGAQARHEASLHRLATERRQDARAYHDQLAVLHRELLAELVKHAYLTFDHDDPPRPRQARSPPT